MPFRVTYVLFLLVVLASCHRETSEEEKVKQVLNELVEADNISDLEGVLLSYTSTIEFYPAGGNFISGIDSVRSSYRRLFATSRLSFSCHIVETKVYGDQAMVTGFNRGNKISLVDSTTSSIDDKFIALLIRNKEGSWKIDKLIWNLNK